MSCAKDKNICDILDDFNNVMEEINCKKKAEKEIDDIKKEIKKDIKDAQEETNEKIKDITEKLLKLIKKVDDEKWVIGEYKWMPVGSKMPLGWVKVNLGEGLTLVQGSKEGSSTGALKKHLHVFEQNKVAWGVEAGGILYFVNRPTNVDTEDDELVPFTKANSKATFIEKTEYAGAGDNNLAAGKFAELWQFKGADYVKREVKKCLEDSIGKSIKKCLDKMDKCCGE